LASPPPAVPAVTAAAVTAAAVAAVIEIVVLVSMHQKAFKKFLTYSFCLFPTPSMVG